MSFRLNGYYIPADTMVLMNIWAIHHDKNAWKDPDTFNPGMCKDDCNNKKTMSHSVIHVNKDESFRHINKIHYRLHLEHHVLHLLTQNASKNLLPPEECNIFYTNCKLKNNQNYKLKKNLFSENLFSIFVSFYVFQNGSSIKIRENGTATCLLA